MGVILLSTVLVQQGRECREEVGEEVVGEGGSGGGRKWGKADSFI